MEYYKENKSCNIRLFTATVSKDVVKQGVIEKQEKHTKSLIYSKLFIPLLSSFKLHI